MVVLQNFHYLFIYDNVIYSFLDYFLRNGLHVIGNDFIVLDNQYFNGGVSRCPKF